MPTGLPLVQLAMQVQKNEIALPETRRVWLVSDGLIKPTFTIHHYYQTRPAMLTDGEAVHEHVFRCFETGAERRFGITRQITEPEDEGN